MAPGLSCISNLPNDSMQCLCGEVLAEHLQRGDNGGSVLALDVRQRRPECIHIGQPIFASTGENRKSVRGKAASVRTSVGVLASRERRAARGAPDVQQGEQLQGKADACRT